jgi:hypothetical protein
LNLMRGSRINPKLSAWAQVHGTFELNRTPIGPPGCRVLAHDKPVNRTKWSPHGLDAWYVGPALDSYRCYNIWVWETRAERICDTVTWFPSKVTIPASLSTGIIMSSLHDIVHALKHPAPASPLAPMTDTHTQALVTLTKLLTSLCQPTTKPEPVPTLRVATPDAPTPSPAPVVVPHPTDAPTTSPAPDVGPQPTDAPTTSPAPDVALTPEPKPLPVAPAPSLRVPTYAQIATPPAPLEPTPSAPPKPTYNQLTGPTGKRRRRQQRRRTKKPAATRRSPRKCQQQANHAKAPIQSTTPVFMTADFEMHFAAHGTTINPDTGCIAEYRALRKCSDGDFWAESNVEEIGRMYQGLGPESNMPTGTDTL